ncbi:Mobile element protein [Bacillus badius]|nr:Mobile element protein [Bacillus badius]
MNEQVDQLCKHLRLAYIADVYEEIPFENPTDFLLQLLKVEKDGREKAKAERNIKKARFL